MAKPTRGKGQGKASVEKIESARKANKATYQQRLARAATSKSCLALIKWLEKTRPENDASTPDQEVKPKDFPYKQGVLVVGPQLTHVPSDMLYKRKGMTLDEAMAMVQAMAHFRGWKSVVRKAKPKRTPKDASGNWSIGGSVTYKDEDTGDYQISWRISLTNKDANTASVSLDFIR